MTYVCVPIAVEDVHRAELDAILAAEKGADLIEYRLDHFLTGEHEEDETERRLESVRILVEDSPRPAIVTIRHASEGGGFVGTETLRAYLLTRICSGNLAVSYVDVEHARLTASGELREAVREIKQSRSDGPRLILSTHDFQGRPSDLTRRLIAMREDPDADVVKIAYRARSLRDNLELFEILRESHGPTIALGMGEFGLMSRVLSPKFGGFLTFASLRDESATAPGQPTIDDLLNLYRFRTIGPETKLFGVMGWPVSHSLSPLVHNAGFKSAGVDAVYLPLPIAADENDSEGTSASFKTTVLSLMQDDHLGFCGASVTMPFKEHLARLASAEGWRVDDASGSLNTLAKLSAGWATANTDAVAVVSLLEDALGGLGGKRVGMIGAGGVARASAGAILSRGAHVVVYNRTLARAEALVDGLRASGGGANAAAMPLDALPKACCEAFVNCTPVGMKAGPDADGLSLPIEEMANAGSSTVYFETVYAPIETPTVRAARAKGWRVIDGVSMFARQAAAQFEIWTGTPGLAERFDALCRERLTPR